MNPCCNAAADEPPHWMAPNEDCMGNPTPGYWRQFLTCSDGNSVIGTGNTSEEAAARASKARDEREVELRLPPEMRLKVLAAGDLGDTAQREAIRLLIQIVVRDKDANGA